MRNEFQITKITFKVDINRYKFNKIKPTICVTVPFLRPVTVLLSIHFFFHIKVAMMCFC